MHIQRFGRRPGGWDDLVGDVGAELYVVVDGEIWSAHRADGTDLVPGDHVRVESVDGLDLTVR